MYPGVKSTNIIPIAIPLAHIIPMIASILLLFFKVIIAIIIAVRTEKIVAPNKTGIPKNIAIPIPP
ncbi:hypothetical protein MASR2M54_19570 [Aliarcobacter cryaerophilus]